MKIKKTIIEGLDYWTEIGKRLAEHMNYKKNSTVLDIGTGGGACLLPAAKMIGMEGQAIGIDLWKNRIDETIENAKKNGLENVSAQIMDARKITFENKTFDYVISGFLGLSQIYDFQKNVYRTENTMMNDVIRILKSNGKIGISTWFKQEELDHLRELIQNYLKNHIKASQKEIDSVPISYSKEHVQGVEKLLKDAGFLNIEILVEDFVLKYQSVEEWFDMMKRVGWILGTTFHKDEKLIQDFKEKMLPKGIESYWKDEGYYFTKSVIFAFGSK
ncbi:MAG: class I SAM-dependent methyltransferase [Candidatus Heimdallarchaeota archaeon]|nr:class I SAM-dependent methyltransferase [Candidatus Heimdallarchaeota archaeon]